MDKEQKEYIENQLDEIGEIKIEAIENGILPEDFDRLVIEHISKITEAPEE